MTKPFTVVVPTKITDTNLVSSTVPENDFPVFDSGITYQIGDRVILLAPFHKIYESIVEDNLGNNPATTSGSWIEVAPTNKFAAFDDSVGTFTVASGEFEFVFTGGAFSAMAFLELNAYKIRIRAYSASAGFYYDKTIFNEDFSIIQNWYDYFFSPIIPKPDIIVTDIPPIENSTYTVTISAFDGSTADVTLGTFIVGKANELGFTNFGAKASIIDYSRKETDTFGRTTLVRRNFSKRMDATVFVKNESVSQVARLLTEIRATPVLWVGAGDDFNLLTVYGFYRDWSVDIVYTNHSLCTLQIEGLVS